MVCRNLTLVDNTISGAITRRIPPVYLPLTKVELTWRQNGLLESPATTPKTAVCVESVEVLLVNANALHQDRVVRKSVLG